MEILNLIVSYNTLGEEEKVRLQGMAHNRDVSEFDSIKRTSWVQRVQYVVFHFCNDSLTYMIQSVGHFVPRHIRATYNN